METTEQVQIKIGLKLMELRKAMGYTSHEGFAYDYDIPRVQYWRMERGRANLTLNSLLKLLRIHRLSIEDFFYSLSQAARK